jgi:hypothetical protein
VGDSVGLEWETHWVPGGGVRSGCRVGSVCSGIPAEETLGSFISSHFHLFVELARFARLRFLREKSN